MRCRPALVVAFLLAAAGALAAESSTTVGLDPGDGPLGRLLGEQARKARALGQRPFVYVGARWCGDCRNVEKNRSHPKLAAAFRGVYLIKLDLDAWDDRLAEGGVAAPKIPAFLALDGAGRPSGRRIDGDGWSRKDAESIAAALDAFFHAD